MPGGFGTRGVEGMICAANWARLNKKPYLGICLGFQTAVIEYSRNVLNLKDANSSEFSKDTLNQVVIQKINTIFQIEKSISNKQFFKIIEMPEHNQGQMGGTMRLGRRKTLFTKPDSVLSKSSCLFKKLVYFV